jgi:putative protease
VLEGTFTEAKKDAWDGRLATVFNRGFWDGYYLGQRLGEWNSHYGSCATEKKVYVGKGVKYFSRLGVAEFVIEATDLHVGDKLLVTGPTTGALYLTLDEMRYDLQPVEHATQGQHISIAVPEKIRPSDKLFKLVKGA